MSLKWILQNLFKCNLKWTLQDVVQNGLECVLDVSSKLFNLVYIVFMKIQFKISLKMKHLQSIIQYVVENLLVRGQICSNWGEINNIGQGTQERSRNALECNWNDQNLENGNNDEDVGLMQDHGSGGGSGDRQWGSKGRGTRQKLLEPDKNKGVEDTSLGNNRTHERQYASIKYGSDMRTRRALRNACFSF